MTDETCTEMTCPHHGEANRLSHIVEFKGTLSADEARDARNFLPLLEELRFQVIEPHGKVDWGFWLGVLLFLAMASSLAWALVLSVGVK